MDPDKNVDTADGPVVVFGEAMIELANVSAITADIGVAGDSYNTAVYMRRAGVPVSYATGLGADSFSTRIINNLDAEEIDTNFIVTIDAKIPGLYAIETDQRGERSFHYWRSDSAARHFFKSGQANALLAKMATARLFYLSGITLSLFEAHEQSLIVELVKDIRARGGTVAFDTNYRPRGWASAQAARRAITALMPHVSLALPTFEDEALLFGVMSTEACAEQWLNAGAAEVVVKAGPSGAFVAETSVSGEWVPPLSVIDRPVDTTGAGDSFNGAYLAARISGTPVKRSVILAHEQANKVLMTPGAIIKR
ncbi:MAG: sugar kinase [Pseudomonadota bacterium]